MLKEIAKSQAGQSKEVYEPRLARDVFLDNLANSSEQPFSGIRGQLASGRLPNLAQHLEAMAAKKRKKVLL